MVVDYNFAIFETELPCATIESSICFGTMRRWIALKTFTAMLIHRTALFDGLNAAEELGLISITPAGQELRMD